MGKNIGKVTVSGMKALFSTLKQVSGKRWYNTIPLSMPIYLISGTMDPVGDYGKGVNEVYKLLKKTGHKNVTIKLYEGARHEILNEINREEVYADIIAWLNEKSEKHQEEMNQTVVVESIDEVITPQEEIVEDIAEEIIEETTETNETEIQEDTE